MISKSNFYEADIKALEASGKTFTVERSGSFTYINYDNKRLQYGPDNHGGVTGAHLSKMVRSDVNRLVTFKQGDVFYSEDPPSVYISQNNLSKSTGDFATQVDMRNCYWKTSYNQGIITKETYLMGLKKKDWKIGRNAAIGSLDKKTTITYYENGKEIESERYLMPRNCRYGRQLVLRCVDHIAKVVMEEICKEGEFLMFITDCFFVLPSAAQKVKDFLNSVGYDYSEANVFMKYHFPQKKMVVWDKIEVGVNSAGKRTVKREEDKFIHYTSSSII
jgi:hypothetical protein